MGEVRVYLEMTWKDMTVYWIVENIVALYKTPTCNGEQ